MTRVLQVLGRSAGGIARHVAQVVESLDVSEGLELDIAGPPGLPVTMPKAMHEVVVPDGPVIGHRRAIARLRRLIDDGGYDVVHAHGLRAGIDSSLAAARKDVHVFVTVHNLVLPEIAGKKAPLYRVAEDLAVRLSGHTFTVSEDIASHLRARVGKAARKVEVLHLGAGPAPLIGTEGAEVKASLGVEEGQRLIVTASRLAPQKAVDVMLEAFARLDERPTLAIFGIGPLEDDLRGLAERLGVADRVRWLGFRSDISDHIAAADVFCLSSIWEGVPLAAMEAVQVGTPVVATDVGGMPELIADGRSGRLVRARDVQALTDALNETLADGGLRARYAAAAAADLETNFSTDRMLSRLRRAYEQGPDA